MNLKDQAFKNLCDFKDIFDDLDIFFWLDGGIVLGLHRGDDLIQGDEDDTDICLWKWDMQKSPEFVARLEEIGFTVGHIWNYRGSAEGIMVARGGNKIDIIAMDVKKNVAFYLARNRSGKMGDLDYFAFVFPRSVYHKFGKIKWRDIEFNCPEDIEGYLVARYGKDWRTPILRGHGYDPYDLKQNPCLRKDWIWDNSKHLL